jgi:hypothetical protein
MIKLVSSLCLTFIDRLPLGGEVGLEALGDSPTRGKVFEASLRLAV